MLRDITTTYNVWNMKEYPKIADAIPGQNQELPESTEITLQAQWLLKNLLFDALQYVAAAANMRFTQTNDIVSTKYVSIDPALGLEFGYTDLVLFEQVLVIFKMYNNLIRRSVFNLILA
jgi:hypothetical protein